MLRRFSKRRWRGRFIASLVFGALLILAGLSAFTYRAYQQTAEELVIENKGRAAYVAAARLSDELTRFSDELTALARQSSVYGNLLREQREAMREARNRLTLFDGGVVLLDNFGRISASQPDRPRIFQADWSDRDVFRNVLGTQKTYYSTIMPEGTDSTPVVAIGVPVLGESSELVGVLAGMFRLGEPRVSSFYASIVRLRIGDGGNIYIVDRDGHILFDSSYRRVGEVLPQSALGSSEVQGTAIRTTSADGESVIASSALIPGTNWTLVIEYDWNLATAATRRYARTLLILLGLGMILPALGVIVLVRFQRGVIRERDRENQEQHVAGLIQNRLIPHYTPMLPGWSMGVYHESTQHEGEDFHDFLLLPDGRLMIAVGHMDDNGLAAAYVLSTARAALRGAIQLGLSPAEALSHANELVCGEVLPDQNLSALCAILEPAEGRMRYANAGFELPWHNSEDRPADAPAQRAFLGNDLTTAFVEQEMVLGPGDWVVFCSGGLRRLCSAKGDAFDFQTLRAHIEDDEGDAAAAARAIEISVQQLIGKGETPAHDITIIVLQRAALLHGAEPVAPKPLVRPKAPGHRP